MAFDPDAYLASVSPPAPTSFDPDAYLANRGAPKAAPAPTEAPGTFEALGRGALQGASLGFSDELTGAIESLFSKKTYQQARDESRANNAAASEAHPWTYGGGELAGGLAGAVVPGAALAKGAALAGEGTALATGLGAASKVANVAAGVVPEGAGLASVAARSALTGGIAGLGGSDAATPGGVAKDVGLGAAAGGIVGGALHGIGSAISKRAPGQFEKDLNEDIFKKARPKDYNQAVAVQKANPEAFRELAYSEDFKPVQKLARAGKTEEALSAANDFVDKAGSQRLKNYEAVAADGYKTAPGPVVERMQKVAANKAANGAPEEAHAIENAAQRVRSELSTIDTGLIKEGDHADSEALARLKPYLPERPTLTKAEFQDAAVELAKRSNPEANYGDVATDLHKAIENLPFRFDPEASISLVQLRKVATKAQSNTKATLGSIAETEHHRIVASVDQTINAALDAHLDAAAKTSAQAAKAVERIRHDNKIISIGLAARDALETRLNKEALGKGQTTKDRLAGAFGKLTTVGGVATALLAHNPLVGGAIAVAPHALEAASAGARRGNDTLARFVYAASQGNPFAKRALATLAQTPGGAARIAALSTSPRSP